MTTTELREKIEAAAEMALFEYAKEFPPVGKEAIAGTFFYGITDEQNLKYDAPMPHIYCDPLQDVFNPGTGVIRWPNIRIACLTQDFSDSVSQQRTPLLERMDWLSLKFIEFWLLDDEELQEDLNITRDDVLKFGTGLLSGKLLNVPEIVSVLVVC